MTQLNLYKSTVFQGRHNTPPLCLVAAHCDSMGRPMQAGGLTCHRVSAVKGQPHAVVLAEVEDSKDVADEVFIAPRPRRDCHVVHLEVAGTQCQ